MTGRGDDGSASSEGGTGTNVGVCTVEAGTSGGAVDVLGGLKERGC